MKRKRMLGLALAALALAGLVSLVTYRLMRRSLPHAATVSVVVAALPLAPGAPLQATDLTVVQLAADAVPAHVFHTVAELHGRVLTVAAVPRQVIDGEMVAQPGEGAGLPPLIPPGMRAVSVKVNDVVSVAGYAVPGTHVDVLLTGNPTFNADPRAITTVTLLSNVQVLTAGEQLEQNANGKPQRVTVITLLVTPEGAQKLALADGYGHIQLALRNPLDAKHPEVTPVVNARLYEGTPVRRSVRRAPRRIPRPAPRPVAPTVIAVELISGASQQTVKFPPAAPAR